MVKLTGTMKQFRKMRGLFGALNVDGIEFYPSVTRGNRFFVDSVNGASTNSGKSPAEAITTLDAAFALCTANNGDIIYVMPKHSETITGAGGIAHDVAGVSVVGLGQGGQRPTFLMDGATTVTYAVTAADAYIENLIFVSGHSNVVACITTTKADTAIVSCEFRNNTTNEDFLTPIKATSTTTGACDGLRVEDCRWVTIDTDDLEFIEINGTCDRVKINGNFVHNMGTASPLILVATGKILTGSEIGWNMLSNRMTANELFLSNDGTTNTGIVHNNYVGHADVTGAHDAGWEGGGWRLFNNLSVSTDALSGFPLPAIDVNL